MAGRLPSPAHGPLQPILEPLIMQQLNLSSFFTTPPQRRRQRRTAQHDEQR